MSQLGNQINVQGSDTVKDHTCNMIAMKDSRISVTKQGFALENLPMNTE